VWLSTSRTSSVARVASSAGATRATAPFRGGRPRPPWRAAAAVALLVVSGCGPNAPSATPWLTVQDVGAVRARLSACLGYTMSQAVAFGSPIDAYGHDDASIACIARSPDCPAVLACAGVGGPACDGAGRCDGDVAVSCVRLPNGRGVEMRDDCAARTDGNSQCAVVDDGGKGIFAACHAGPCTNDRCEGDVLVSCFGPVEIRSSCLSLGQICSSDGTGPLCTFAAACAIDHCDGTTAVLCGAGHEAIRQDCAALMPDGHCRAQGAVVDCFAAPPDPACGTGEPYSSRCDGASGLVCYAGARLQVDCAAFGATCEADPALGEARCRLP